MALSQEVQENSLDALTKRYQKRLTPKKAKLLKAINILAATDNVPLHAQSEDVMKILGTQLEKPFDESSLSDVAVSIYSMIIEQMDRETEENKRRHRAAGTFDQKYIHQHSLCEELQDHHMTFLMPKSYGDIEVLAQANRFDSRSIEAVEEGVTSALKNKQINHIFIPIGPGHWRGIYLTKPNDGTDKYELELFDPYGPSGAKAIREITLNLLKNCGIKEEQITIKFTGPLLPQRDGYACGDFTCAYSHKKMKECGAKSIAYNQDLITVLDSYGNKDNLLRHAIREVSKKLAGPEQIAKQEPFTEIEKRKFLIRLEQIFSDPNQIDKAVFDRKIATIKSTSKTEPKPLSLRELDAYGVFNSDGSINKDIAAQYGIIFDESRIKTRLSSSRFKNLSVREMIVFESVIGAGEQEYIREGQPSKGLDKACFADFWPANSFKLLTNPLSMELTGPAQQMIGMGYFKFKNTNVSISPGPNAARSLTPATNPELYEVEHDIVGYLSNLLRNNVTHVFAMGRMLPYYPQEGDRARKIRTDQIVFDFINYFIPDAHGHVKLPDIPELKGIHITSRPIKKVGRFITYEISINGRNPIQVHHFPVRDKQPLELTLEELAYVKRIGQTTPPEQNIHTHCRGGKGRSAQIAYLLASLNPKYAQLNHEQRLALMRAEKAPHDNPEYFIETELQKDYIEGAGPSIRNDITFSLDKHIELYSIYGTLLKQEIDKLRQRSDLPTWDQEKRTALLELMEKYQELSSTPLNKLENWVTDVCHNKILADSTKTKTLLISIKSSTDFLLYAFKENMNFEELELFFGLQARNGSYANILKRFALMTHEIANDIESRAREQKITPQQAQIERNQFEKNKALFVAHIQNAHLKNWIDVTEEEQIFCKVEVNATISETITRIFNTLKNHDPKKFTKAEFENLKNEYYQCKQRIELLENAERHDKDKILNNDELQRRCKILEQQFILGYDYFELESLRVPVRMELIYQQLVDLSLANQLSPQNWNELKKRCSALQIIFNLSKPIDMATPPILSTLDELFQGKREHTELLPELFKKAVLQVEPKEENLNEFVAGLGFAVLEVVFARLPQKYYGDNANGIYSKEINQLLDIINQLADIYQKPAEKGTIDLHKPLEIPTAKEYDEARQQVLEFISTHVPPFLIPTIALSVKTEATKVSNLDGNAEHPLDSSIDRYLESKKNTLRIKAMRDAAISGNARETQDEIDYLKSRAKKTQKNEPHYPKRPKLMVFDLDDRVLDLKVKELTNALQYAQKHGIDVVLTPRKPGEETPSATLKKMLQEKTGNDLTNYYQRVEGGILKDFKNPKFTKNIEISDFKDKEEIWTNLFKLAKVLMHSPSLKNPKPSLQAILKDLIFDADKPGRLQEKYGDLHQDEAIQQINDNKSYFIQHIPQIESFYQNRLAVKKFEYVQEIEEDVVFLHDQQNIEQTIQPNNYRLVKVSTSEEDSPRYMVELNYEMGAYNAVIAYLNGDTENSLKNYGSNNINKTLELYLKDIIPNFIPHEFRHSPIVLHVKMSTILKKLPELNKNESVQKCYKKQFFEAAIERYQQLAPELQDDFIKEYYLDTHSTLDAINQRLKQLIKSPPKEPALFREELTKLKIQADKIMEMDEKFSQQISPTFLHTEAKFLRAMIIASMFAGNLNSLKIEADKVQFKAKHDETRTMFDVESMRQKPDVYRQEIHPVLKEMDVFNKGLVAEQYTHFVAKHLKEIIDVYISKNDPSSTLNAQVQTGKYPSLQSLLDTIRGDINKIDLNQNAKFTQIHSHLTAAEKLCQALMPIVPYQTLADNLKKQPEVNYKQQISDLLQQLNDYKSKIEDSDQYKAKLFLDKAEQYLLAKNWNVGWQWHSHIEKVAGKDKKVPATVAEQLKILRQARIDGNYIGDKTEFLRIGKQKEISLNSSKVARNYYSLFKKDKSLEKDLEKEFVHQQRI